MAMESTPDSGVDIKKAVVAPLLAPCFFSDAAAGSTPQDHIGVNLGVPSTSPNFLAFSSNAQAFPPETMNFDITYFSLDFAGSVGTISLTTFNNSNYVGTVSLLSTPSNSSLIHHQKIKKPR